MLVLVTLLTGACWFSNSAWANSPDRLSRILQQKSLRVCIWPDYYSITFRNPRTGQLNGFDIDMAQQFAKDLGVELTFVNSSFAALMDNLVGDQCDIAMHGVAITEARLEKLSFSEPYLKSDFYAVTTKSHPTVTQWDDIDKPDVVVGIMGGTVMEPVMRKALRQAQIELIYAPKTREQELEAGRIDVFITDYPYSRKVLDNADWAALLGPSKPFFITNYAYAIAKVKTPGDQRWLNRINQFLLATKNDGRLLAIARRYKLERIAVSDKK
ncbi:amino acid ABC transporter substrate-binding protein [Parvibium lacunae]|uniref:Amino acid ABC transporter substrate-binding protein n=2 Tax=Parvibium lacunae TaxID=1888893 RepID=A0A368L8B7_9BURK|nr:amino acid ABC transporter substrate-binding protein [Parvibium lacunae]